MLKRCPHKYWKNMPETAGSSRAVAGAQARESAMVEAGGSRFGERPKSLSGIDERSMPARRCPIGLLDNRAVMGEGPQGSRADDRRRQPGDQEDLAGPVSRAGGKVLNAHLERAGIERRQVYLTTAVKHFKLVPRSFGAASGGLHQSPTAKEIDICRFWLESERAVVKPRAAARARRQRRQRPARARPSASRKRAACARARGRQRAVGHCASLYLLRLDGEARESRSGCSRPTLPRSPNGGGAGGRLTCLPDPPLTARQRRIEVDPATIAPPPRAGSSSSGWCRAFRSCAGLRMRSTW